MTVTINGTLGVTTPQVTLAGAGISAVLQPPTTPGTYTATLPAVSGELLMSSVTMNFPTTLGTPGQVLMTDGFGNLAWTTVTGGAGAVMFVAVNGGTTGLTTTGGPITSSGTIVLGGTLNIASGGTGATNATAALNNLIPVSVSQIKEQLIVDGTMQTVSDAVPADVTNIVNVRWFIGMTFVAGDPLYNFIMSTLSYTVGQMTTLMTNAAARQK